MTRRLVWHFADSPVAGLLEGLPADLEPQPLPTRGFTPHSDEDGALLVDVAAGDLERSDRVSPHAPDVPIVALLDSASNENPPSGCHAHLIKPVPAAILVNALRKACDHARLTREHEQTRQQLEELNAIGVRLTAERDTDVLLELILTKAREITRSDAGSIYLVEVPESGAPRLRFKLAQNDSVRVPFTEFSLPINERSIAGYVALTGKAVVVDDAYLVPEGDPFRINRDFDAQIGYRTKSMLVVAMRTPAGEVIGVLQLINRKRACGRIFDGPETAEREVLPYDAASRDLAASLASQAAVALENSRLYQSIHALFEGFVQASVTAIESRDPTTSGHSFRVANLTVALAAAVDRLREGPLRHVKFSSDEMREIRYASLLHDFGKVGVREEVLVKAKKLSAGRLELIHQRGEIIKRGLELTCLRRKLDRLLAGGAEDFLAVAAPWDAELACQFAEIDRQLALVVEANEPAILPEDCGEHIRHLAVHGFSDPMGGDRRLITPEEARILSIPRGSLTEEEFAEIQSHVVHTARFLKQIPWTRELRRIPEIAGAHHEKLDGSGYPMGKQTVEIPLQARMMTISDVFDALTATDRPYKSAVPVPVALDILTQEATRGALDATLLDLFIAIRAWEPQTRA